MINKHVTSLELSKKLKELGVAQKSEFYWVKHWGMPNPSTREPGYVWGLFQKDIDDKVNEHVSAYLASELGEMLPMGYLTWWYAKNDGTGETVFRCSASVYDDEKITFESITEADVRAKMLIYLIENSLLKPEDLV